MFSKPHLRTFLAHSAPKRTPLVSRRHGDETNGVRFSVVPAFPRFATASRRIPRTLPRGDLRVGCLGPVAPRCAGGHGGAGRRDRTSGCRDRSGRRLMDVPTSRHPDVPQACLCLVVEKRLCYTIRDKPNPRKVFKCLTFIPMSVSAAQPRSSIV